MATFEYWINRYEKGWITLDQIHRLLAKGEISQEDYDIYWPPPEPEPEPEPYVPTEEDFEEQRIAKLRTLYDNVKNFINTLPNGFPRYDTDLKLNIINVVMTAALNGQPKPENCSAVEAWIYTVQGDFIMLSTQLKALEYVDETSFDALNAIDVSYDYFDSKYGREGTVLVDPQVTTTDLFS